MIEKIVSNVIRIAALIVIVLGLLLWTGNHDDLKGLHMLCGIIIVLGLWTLAARNLLTGGNVGLSGGAILLGLIAIGLGLKQESLVTDSSHWIIQVIHLLIGLLAIGFSEMLTPRIQRQQLVRSA